LPLLKVFFVFGSSSFSTFFAKTDANRPALLLNQPTELAGMERVANGRIYFFF
jgi:hypothetical protein